MNLFTATRKGTEAQLGEFALDERARAYTVFALLERTLLTRMMMVLAAFVSLITLVECTICDIANGWATIGPFLPDRHSQVAFGTVVLLVLALASACLLWFYVLGPQRRRTIKALRSFVSGNPLYADMMRKLKDIDPGMRASVNAVIDGR